MGHTFGLFTKSQQGVLFANMRAKIAEDYDTGNPNHPEHLPQSPNAPRSETDRHGDENNPILGDPGYGQIGRWQTVQLDALENTIDQIIEQYLRDKSWYASVRCREALWNMYRRIEWWVMQQQPPDKTQYQRVLQMIKDCIYKILENAQEPGGTHLGVSLPTCPAPYYHHFSGNYFNHFDATVYEIPLFSMKEDVPFSGKFPDFFRYVSSTEDQEWVTVHSVGKNEQSGADMILKLDLGLLEIGNSSKITFNWRVKRYGQVRFKYLASAKRGNGMLFYINGQQVGGEWSENTGWQQAAFTLQPGQMYKFDWLIRKMRPEVWQHNGIYIKDIEVVEIVDTRKFPAPPDYDLDGEEVRTDGNWVVRSPQSIAQAHFSGQFITDDRRSKTMTMELDNECDGTISFAYKMGIDGEPYPNTDYNLFFDDQFTSRTQHGDAPHGSYADSLHGVEWIQNGEYSETEVDNALITYEVVVGEDTTVDIFGNLEVICPPRIIDHWEPYHLGQGLSYYSWSMSGSPNWVDHLNYLRIDEPQEGVMVAQTTVYIPDDGWFIFNYAHDLRPTEAFEVMVNGVSVYYTREQGSGSGIRIPLSAGNNNIQFLIRDSYTEQPFMYNFEKVFSYGGSASQTYRTESPLGSYVDIQRDWDSTDGGAKTENNGDTINYNMRLNPGAKVTFKEHMRIYPAMDGNYDPVSGDTRDIMVFEELFNEEDNYDPALTFSSGWDWVDLSPPWIDPSAEVDPSDPPPVGDGVMWAEGHGGEYTCDFSASISNSGYICWQYGGQFDSGEMLELQIDGVTVWTGNEENGDAGTNCMYPLPPGNHTFRWVYRDGSVYIPGNEGSGGSGGGSGSGSDNPFGEHCYPSGSEVHGINYGQTSSRGEADRTSSWAWGNQGGIYYDGGVPIAHGVEQDGKIITRSFYAPEFGEVDYFEKLKVYPAQNVTTPGLRPINMSALNQDWYTNDNIVWQHSTQKYYVLKVKGLRPGNPLTEFDTPHTKKVFERFYCDGSLSLSFLYHTYIWTGDQRARFRVYLIPDSNPSKKITLLDEKDNQGYHDGKISNFENITNNMWAEAEPFSVTKAVSPGWYTIVFGITDTYPDYDYDESNNFYFHATINNISLKTSDPTGLNDWRLIDKPRLDDQTYVLVDLYDKETGQKVYSQKYYGNDGNVATYNINFSGYTQPGKSYTVQYTLRKGNGSGTGLNGGGFTLSGGKFNEYWNGYCVDAQGNVYPSGDSPHPDDGWWTDPPPDTTAPDGGSHVWLDVIRLYENMLDACPGSRIAIKTYEGSNLIDTKYVVNTDDEFVEITVDNTSDEIKDYRVEIKFEQGCPGDGAMIWGGSFSMEDSVPVDKSWAEVTHFEVWDNKPVWMGGCDDSHMRVRVIREDGSVVLDQRYYGEAYHEFSVTGLQPTPYTKYRVEITTDQKGYVSSWTGKRYMTTFRMHDFKVYERWVWVPEPFDSQLDFFIDGELIKTFTTEGGYYTFSYPVPKGKHEFKWVFTSYQEVGVRSYEYAQLDWMELTNWICDDVYVTPYCEGGGGDQCVEALIKCLLDIWKSRPKMCVIGKRIWLFT